MSDNEIKTYDAVRLNGLIASGYGFVAKIPMCDQSIKAEAKALYCFLCALSGASGTAFPSSDTIQYYLGICNTTMQKYRNQLNSAGYITIRGNRDNGKFHGFTYIINNMLTSKVNKPEMVTPEMKKPEMVTPEMKKQEMKKPEMTMSETNNNKRKTNNPKKINLSINTADNNPFVANDGWIDIVDYRKKYGHLPYNVILSSPASIDAFITSLLHNSNQYLDDCRKSYAAMFPSVINSLLSSDTSSVCGTTIVPIQVLKLIDRHIVDIIDYPFISIDSILDTAIDDYTNGVSHNNVTNKLGYMRSCLYTALAVGDAGVNSDLSRCTN